MSRHYLTRVFEPESIAIIGASERENSVAGQVLLNLLDAGYAGDIYPINPKHETVLGHRCYRGIGDIGHPVDLVMVAVPAPAVPSIMRQCADVGVIGVVVMSAGFGEAGPRGRALQDEIVEIARRNNIRMIGPNCLGIIRPRVGLNATFSKSPAATGQIALVAQSGAIGTALLDWADSQGFGFSALASLGGTADIGFGELLDYLASDPYTKSILLYVEGISDARSFLSGLRIAARMKPVIVVKSGRNDAGRRAANSHTGALVGSDDVFDAAIRRAGAVRVKTVNQLFSAARLLASGARVNGNRLCVITNGGGPGVMAADRAFDIGVPLAELSNETMEKLSAELPEHWSHSNPVDVLGDAEPERYGNALKICLSDKGVDGVLVMLTPQAMTNPTSCAEAVCAASKGTRKPVLTCWMGDRMVVEARARFIEAGIPHFSSPEASVEAFAYLACYRENQKSLLQSPSPLSDHPDPDIEGARLIIDQAVRERRKWLTTMEAKAILTAFRIKTTPCINANSATEALIAAESVGLPVVMKINSPDITHKSDVGGVRLNISEARSVRSAFKEMMDSVKGNVPDARIQGITIEPMISRPHARELFVGVVSDPVFGPTIAFGTGGTTVEIFRDRNIALPPLNDFLSEELIKGTKAAKLVGPFRNLPAADSDAVEEVLLRASEIACELPEVDELDINPLIADENGALAVDVRISVRQPRATNRRYGHMAIHPYPFDLDSSLQLPNGTDVVFRPIRPEDARMEAAFVAGLSQESKYFRFMQSLDKLTPEMLARFTQIDYDREMALVAVVNEEQSDQVIGVVRYVTNPDQETCEFALTIADAWQAHGLGSELMKRLMAIARDRGLEYMEGDILANNTKMLGLVKRLGFRVQHSEDEPSLMRAQIRL
ncbi:MAG: GNAT family N-acetyltransferase [Gammaproteobacteria bacterium]